MPAKMQLPLRDRLGRPLESLRLSVTDRCNLRCLYCMPEEEYVWLPRQELLSFEELVRLVAIFTGLGVTRLRLTGGEPLLRHNLDRLIAMLTGNPRIKDLALTTNGLLFADQSEALKRAGLGRVTISLDTLQRERFRQMTRRDEHHRVLVAFEAARRAGFTGTKLDAVIMRGENDDELADLIEFGRSNDVEVRFIEYMDVLGATKCCSGSSSATVRSHRSPKPVQLPLRVLCCRTVPSSASSPLRRLLFAELVTAAESPPMACGIAAYTRRTAQICESS